jgi:hypothetical protein
MSCSSDKGRHNSSLKNSARSGEVPEPLVGAVPITVSASERGYAQASVVFDVLPSGNGFHPTISIGYSSSQPGPGLAGIGWDLNGMSSIARCPKHRAFEGTSRAVTLGIDDSLCLDGKKILLTEGSNFADGAVYRLYLDQFKKLEMERRGITVKHQAAVNFPGKWKLHGIWIEFRTVVAM